jgi:ketosteroid isomerase-like protein
MSTTELFLRHHSFIGKDVSVDEASEVYHADVTMEFPYAPKHHTRRRVGIENVLGFLKAIGVYFTDIQMAAPSVLHSTDPNVIVVEYPGESTCVETGLPYRQSYIAVVTAVDGKISHIREYYDPIQVLVSTGEIEEPGG